MTRTDLSQGPLDSPPSGTSPVVLADVRHESLSEARLEWPRRWERWGVIGLLMAAIGFGVVVELRGALLHRPLTDVQVYFRAAWAARTGADLYTITDDNRWHYQYPPLLAILLMPLADAPGGVDRTGLIPFAVSVGLWYVFSMVCLVAGVHGLACALEETSPDSNVRSQPAGCRRWWALRLIPILACLPTIGATLARGQVNLLVLALLCFMAAATLRGRSWRAGLWLAGAVSLKVIPAFLILYPLWRRDFRCLLSCALGLVLGLGIIPVLWLGPQRTLDEYREWNQVLLRPALGQGEDQSRAKELLEMTATDSQSLMSLIHRWRYPDLLTRPPHAEPGTTLIHWLGGGLLTVLTLVIAGGRASRQRLPAVLLLGLLMLLMVLLSPVCHPHYFCLALPLIMGLVAADMETTGHSRLAPPLKLLLIVYVVSNALTHSSLPALREAGLSGSVCLCLWLVGVVVLRKRQLSPLGEGLLLPSVGAVSLKRGLEWQHAP